MSEVHKLYVPAGNWLVENLTTYCQSQRIGNAEITGIGSITDIWVLLDPAGTPVVRNFSASPSYEMTSLVGNVTLRQGVPVFDPAKLSSGAYPQFDAADQTYNCYVHSHVTFANPDMSISGGHLLDAQVSIGAEVVIRAMAGPDCVPGLPAGQMPADCVMDASVAVPPLGVFSNWDPRFWYPPAKPLPAPCTRPAPSRCRPTAASSCSSARRRYRTSSGSRCPPKADRPPSRWGRRSSRSTT
jgi:predicted DNA-binding protein with PD1-like motif